MVETAGSKIRGRGYLGENYVERKIRFNFVQEVTARTREEMVNETFSPFLFTVFLRTVDTIGNKTPH